MEPRQTGPDELTYASRRRQLQVCLAVIGLYLVTFSVVFEPDYLTHTRPKPSAYLWQVVPFAVLTMIMAARAFRARIVTTPAALHLYRVTSHEELAWADVRGFEVHRSPSGRFASVVARLATGRTVRVALFRRDRKTGTSAEARRLADVLIEDRAERLGGRGTATATSTSTPASA